MLFKGECTGCRTAHNKGDCYTFDCVDNKKIDYCGLCKDFPCNEIMTREKATVLDLRWLQWKKFQRDKGITPDNWRKINTLEVKKE